MIGRVVIPPRNIERSTRNLILEVMLAIATGRPLAAPDPPRIYLYVLGRRFWDNWEVVTVWYLPEDRRRVRRWMAKVGLLPNEKGGER